MTDEKDDVRCGTRGCDGVATHTATMRFRGAAAGRTSTISVCGECASKRRQQPSESVTPLTRARKPAGDRRQMDKFMLTYIVYTTKV